MDVKIMRLVVGPLQENCYLVYNENKECVVIDPGYSGKDLLKVIEDNHLNVLYILLTHGHIDHIGAVAYLKDKLKIEVYMHENDRYMLEDTDKKRASLYGMDVESTKVDKLVREGDKIKFSDYYFTVIETPGHTGGGVCYLIDDILFSGDTLFKGSIGRYDFPESDGLALMNSLKKLKKLDPKIYVLPGHGDETTIEEELQYNPYLRRI
ncbi:MBL fold metallo-hydrolase [Peptoniphilus raoultii]|uniref:MBL fold metallo-hydrolase n=1 Tax=Peptoniphilus raoultii TaxID=1776387 RepID=UPI0008DA38B8|nr:MBL fold metallo-hydrolase [Peptoniphilus raoultii]